ncbi:hypothetical protein RHMOL_Rhmol06G0186400 [Rhododendron molle]|uniref:Uncharacterized protein n=1 Tax=Rhododendron molle TaxID=49168 RepID=A0ACC0NEK9_RHOML|nr:hypothetical protein RHMOL_Rhmol06G0186400 [Rhododendron molle]
MIGPGLLRHWARGPKEPSCDGTTLSREEGFLGPRFGTSPNPAHACSMPLNVTGTFQNQFFSHDDNGGGGEVVDHSRDERASMEPAIEDQTVAVEAVGASAEVAGGGDGDED